ncbi:MAG: hypothetical protein ABEI52_09215, partial [Halobacteriaceae archaeon]
SNSDKQTSQSAPAVAQSCAQARAYIEDALDTDSPERAYDLLQKALSTLESPVDPDGAVAKALCELKKADDLIAEQGNELAGGRLHSIADEAADEVGLEITVKY